MEGSLNNNKNCKIYVNSNAEEGLSEEEKVKHLEAYYHNIIENFTTEPILGNDRGMSLENIYIEPEYQILQGQTKSANKDYGDRFVTISDDSIHSFLDAYVAKGTLPENLKTKNANIILLLGQPGQGKTSFSKKLMYDYCCNRTDRNYFMIRLRDIGNVDKLLEEPLETIGSKLQRILGFAPNLEEETVLLLDGLDELAMKEQLVTETIDSFLETLITLGKDYPKLKIILTSRTLYVNIEKLSKKLKSDILTLQLHEFSLEKQIEWLEKYKVFYSDATMTQEILEKLHSNKNEHILELISQPILLHMITELNMTHKELTQSTNRAKIYKQMFDSIINRKWEDGKEHENLKGLEPDDVRELLQTIAFEIYKSDYEYIHRSKLEKLPALKEFYKSIDIDIDDTERLDGILKGVLISFYFQEVKKDGDDEVEESGNYAIEFMHKSLQEYLVAEKMFDEMLRIIAKDRRKYFITDYKEVLKIAWKLFSSQQISGEIQTYLVNIIQNYEDKNKKVELVDRLANFLPELFEKDFLYVCNLNEDINPIEKSLIVFYGYWSILSHLGGEKNYIQKSFNQKINLYINLFSIYFFSDLHFKKEARSIPINLSYQETNNWFRGVSFMHFNFYKSNLSKSNFEFCWFSQTNMSYANFKNCSFRNCDLNNCDFSESNLNNCYFFKSSLKNAIFSNTQLNNIKIDDENAEYLRELGVEFTRAEEGDEE